MAIERKNKFALRHANGEMSLLCGEVTNVIRQRFAREDIYASCLTCIFMNAVDRYNPVCTKYNARPPIDILVNSCPDYSDNQDIPL